MARLSHSDLAIIEPEVMDDDYYDTHTVLTDAAIDRWSFRNWSDRAFDLTD